MNIKSQVLQMLENNRGNFISGSKIAKELYISRNAVWKAVNSLKEDGYKIDSTTNKGYMLTNDNSIVSSESIKKYLNDDLNIIMFDEIDSTNKYLKTIASEGAKEGTVVVAKKQTSGRGRLGKTFYSPDDTGIYFSILLRPNISAQDSLKLTVMSAVAVAKIVKKYCNKNIQIKWVNDIYADGKKLCGILTEGSVSIENGGLDFAIIGIGINIKMPNGGFPDEIKDIATSVFEDDMIDDAKSVIVAEIINTIMNYYHNDSLDYIKTYQSLSYLDGKNINIIHFDKLIPAVAMGIDDDCHLVVKTDDGQIHHLSSGDVSVRLK